MQSRVDNRFWQTVTSILPSKAVQELFSSLIGFFGKKKAKLESSLKREVRERYINVK